MLAALIGYGLAAVAVIITAEGLVAQKQKRKAETGAALFAGATGIAFFIAMLYAGGVL
jgi:hypothetical protein